MLNDLGIGSDDSPRNISIDGVNKEREIGLPGDWKEIFDRSISTDHDTILQDAKNLFTLGANEFGIKRSYYVFDQSRNEFVPRTYAFLDEPNRLAYVLIGNAMWKDSKSIDFMDKSGWSPISFKGRFANRDLEFSFSSKGELVEVIYRAYSSSRSEKNLPEELVGFISPHGFVHGELKFNIELTDDGIKIARLDTEVTDEIFAPLKFDPDHLRDDLFPSRLRENPADTNVDLDNGWKGVDPFHKVGIIWKPTSDDSINSLQR